MASISWHYVDPSVATTGVSTDSHAPANSFQSALAHIGNTDDCGIRLAAGYLYAPLAADRGYHAHSFSKTPATRFCIESYIADSMPNPTIPPTLSALEWDAGTAAAGWSSAGGGTLVWKKTFGALASATKIMRCLWVGAYPTGIITSAEMLGTGYNMGVKMPPIIFNSYSGASGGTGGIIDVLNHTNAAWAQTNEGGNFTVYIWTGSDSVSPGATWGGLAFCADYTGTWKYGAYNGLELKACQRIYMRDFDILGGSNTLWITAESYGACNDIDVNNVNTLALGVHGIFINGHVSNAIRWVRVHHSVIDAKSNPGADPNPLAAVFRSTYSQDALDIRGYAQFCSFDHGSILGADHSGVSLGAYPNEQGTTDCGISNVVIDGQGYPYGRAIGTGVGKRLYADRTLSINQPAWLEIMGDRPGCSFKITNSAARDFCPVYPNYVGTNGTPYTSGIRTISMFSSITPGSGGADSTPAQLDAGTLVVENCSLHNPIAWPFAYQQFACALTNDSAQFTNFYVVDKLYAATRMFTGSVSGNGASFMAQVTSGSIPRIPLSGVTFVRTATGGSVLLAYAGGVTYRTISTINSVTNCTETTVEQTDANLRPIVGSTLLGSGSAIARGRRDLDGRQHQVPPSRGAYDAAPTRRVVY